METSDLLTNRLRLWRVRNGLTEAETGDLCGLSESMISRVERGERDLAPLTKVKVARCLGVRVRDLFDVPDPVEGPVENGEGPARC